MNKFYSSLTFSILFFFCSWCGVAQNNHVSYQGSGELAEQLWQTNEAAWIRDMSQSLNVSQSDFRDFLNYNGDEFNKVQGAFFSGFMNGTISTGNATNYFDNLKNK